MNDSLIIIFIAETDPDYVYQISSDIQKQFQKHLGKHYSETLVHNLIFNILESGLMEVISPPLEFYPDMTHLKKTLGWFWFESQFFQKLIPSFFLFLGDDMERVTWRSKQSLDFSFLMMYAKSRGTFYVQLEDDVLTKKVLQNHSNDIFNKTLFRDLSP